MNQDKGFSLIEVLVSLLLVTSISMAVLEQQWQVGLLLKKILQHSLNAQSVDAKNESSYINQL